MQAIARDSVTASAPWLESIAASTRLAELQRTSVSLWVEGDELRYRAPKGRLTWRELESIRALKAQIVAALTMGGESVHGGREVERAPLSYSQLAHWQTYDLERRSAI